MNGKSRPQAALQSSPAKVTTTDRVIYGAPFGQAPTPWTYQDIVAHRDMREYLEGITRKSRCLDCRGDFTSPEAAAQHAHRAGHAVRLDVTTSSVVGSLGSLCRVVI